MFSLLERIHHGYLLSHPYFHVQINSMYNPDTLRGKCFRSQPSPHVNPTTSSWPTGCKLNCHTISPNAGVSPLRTITWSLFRIVRRPHQGVRKQSPNHRALGASKSAVKMFNVP